MKDPILFSYTLEELAYEYFDHLERKKAEDERIQKDADKIEEDKQKAAEAWADEMERQEEEKPTSNSEKIDPSQDPASIEWMNKMIEENKKEFGDSFGDDISMNFGQ